MPLCAFVREASCYSPSQPVPSPFSKAAFLAWNHHCPLASCLEFAHYREGIDNIYLYLYFRLWQIVSEHLHHCLHAMAKPADRGCGCLWCGVGFLFPLPLEIREAGTLELFMVLPSEIFMASWRPWFFDTCHLFVCHCR